MSTGWLGSLRADDQEPAIPILTTKPDLQVAGITGINCEYQSNTHRPTVYDMLGPTWLL